jgi:hypothetical protein
MPGSKFKDRDVKWQDGDVVWRKPRSTSLDSPTGRVFVVALEERIFPVPLETRIFQVLTETRIFSVPGGL